MVKLELNELEIEFLVEALESYATGDEDDLSDELIERLEQAVGKEA